MFLFKIKYFFGSCRPLFKYKIIIRQDKILFQIGKKQKKKKKESVVPANSTKSTTLLIQNYLNILKRVIFENIVFRRGENSSSLHASLSNDSSATHVQICTFQTKANSGTLLSQFVEIKYSRIHI